MKVYASCQPDQVPSSLMYSARGCENDKNNGTQRVNLQEEISPGQTTLCRDFTEITCSEDIENECALSPDFTFHKRRETDRIFFVKGTNRGRKAWYCVLLVDDHETIRIFKEKTQGELGGTEDVNLGDYGEVLRSGSGEEPPQEVKDWFTRVCDGIEVLTY